MTRSAPSFTSIARPDLREIGKQKPPPSLAGVLCTSCNQPAVDDEVAIGATDDEVVIIGASEAGAIGVTDDVVIIGASDDGAIALDSADDAADIASDTAEDAADEAADDIAASDDEMATALEDAAVFTTVVLLPRLKIQIRPMMTITATMMIIQVLRFMGLTLCLRKVDREV